MGIICLHPFFRIETEPSHWCRSIGRKKPQTQCEIPLEKLRFGKGFELFRGPKPSSYAPLSSPAIASPLTKWVVTPNGRGRGGWGPLLSRRKCTFRRADDFIRTLYLLRRDRPCCVLPRKRIERAAETPPTATTTKTNWIAFGRCLGRFPATVVRSGTDCRTLIKIPVEHSTPSGWREEFMHLNLDRPVSGFGGSVGATESLNLAPICYGGLDFDLRALVAWWWSFFFVWFFCVCWFHGETLLTD